jgi:hypothetical protein
MHLKEELMKFQTIQQMLDHLGTQYELDQNLSIFEKVTIVSFLANAPKLLKLKKK